MNRLVLRGSGGRGLFIAAPLFLSPIVFGLLSGVLTSAVSAKSKSNLVKGGGPQQAPGSRCRKPIHMIIKQC